MPRLSELIADFDDGKYAPFDNRTTPSSSFITLFGSTGAYALQIAWTSSGSGVASARTVSGWTFTNSFVQFQMYYESNNAYITSGVPEFKVISAGGPATGQVRLVMKSTNEIRGYVYNSSGVEIGNVPMTVQTTPPLTTEYYRLRNANGIIYMGRAGSVFGPFTEVQLNSVNCGWGSDVYLQLEVAAAVTPSVLFNNINSRLTSANMAMM